MNLQRIEADLNKAQASFTAALERKEKALAEQRAKEQERKQSYKLYLATLEQQTYRLIAAADMQTRVFQEYVKTSEAPKRAFMELAWELLNHPVIGLTISGDALYWNLTSYSSLTEVAIAIQCSLLGNWDAMTDTQVNWLVAMLGATYQNADDDARLRVRRVAVDAALDADVTLERPDGLIFDHAVALSNLGVGSKPAF